MEVLAKEEYTRRLILCLSPGIYEGIQTIWKAAKRDAEEEPRKLITFFQKRLENVSQWNQGLIDKEYDRIVEQANCSAWINKLIDAVFVSHVKILSSIRLNVELSTIKLIIPEPKSFVHKCYLVAARRFFLEPELLEDRPTRVTFKQRQKNLRQSYVVIGEAITDAIREMLPISDILNESFDDTAIDQKEDLKEEHRRDSGYVEENEENQIAPAAEPDTIRNQIGGGKEDDGDGDGDGPTEEEVNEAYLSDKDEDDDDNDNFMKEPKVNVIEGDSIDLMMEQPTKKSEDEPFFPDDDDDDN